MNVKNLFIKIFPETSIQILYFRMFGKFAKLKAPVDIYEKLMFLNFNNRDPRKTLMSDKYAVRIQLEKLGLSEYLNELLGVYDNPSDIDYDSLPDKFVLKCTHGANFNIICKDKSHLDIIKTEKQLRKWLRKDYSLNYAELHYHGIPRRIICEKFLGPEIMDYKVYCFNGRPEILMVCTNPSEGPVKYYFYTLDWEYKDYLIHHYPDPCFKKPDCLDELLRLASKVSEGFKFARVDTFIFENKPIFGEITFTPSGFLDNTTTRELNIELGKLIDIEI